MDEDGVLASTWVGCIDLTYWIMEYGFLRHPPSVLGLSIKNTIMLISLEPLQP
jgi:hypothetical protein